MDIECDSHVCDTFFEDFSDMENFFLIFVTIFSRIFPIWKTCLIWCDTFFEDFSDVVTTITEYAVSDFG